MHRCVAIVALLLQAGFAILGSGGLHALPGHCCAHVDAAKAAPHGGHHHCGHHHVAPAEAPRTGSPRPVEPVDHDCSICELFVTGATVALPVAIEEAEQACVEAGALLSPAIVETLPRGHVAARGPPRV